jgi:hypothetical protein
LFKRTVLAEVVVGAKRHRWRKQVDISQAVARDRLELFRFIRYPTSTRDDMAVVRDRRADVG